MPSARVSSLGHRLRGLRWWRRARPGSGGPEAPPGNDPQDRLRQAGSQLRQRREELGLSLRELAHRTRITTPVLEALERGWPDRLPEAAYLRSMLVLIERELDLPAGSLAAALPERPSGPSPTGQRDRLRRFTPGSIDVYTTWQGTVLYGLLTLALIYGLNLLLRRQADALALTPMPLLPLPVDGVQPDATRADLPEALTPVRPLSALEQQGPLERFRRAVQPPAPLQGELSLELTTPGQITISVGGGPMGATAPELSIRPVPDGEPRVLWNGRPLEPIAGESGRYRLKAAAEPAAADDPPDEPAPPAP
ncbi:helix-turn-helix domain-containing protein [Synechococcus sp. RSCCF101]|uniref:helix-turn-helix domain-containing protein n=1 Tax=Synechococcus sp. RSCCF101 TaxID=2511069 RepID=UPI0012481C65|nr:helix-turn-helix transcriptional regulator [Synechococcus sp. RSCCF101]QEY31132.1 helix-turn-helix domain-containing protein [Synechococcus sp. RSCCF101]